MSNLESWMMFRHFKLFVLTYLTAISFGSLLHAVEDEKYFVEKYYPIIYSQDDTSVFFLAGDIDIRTSLNFKRAVLDVGTPELLVLNSNGGLVYIGLDLALELGVGLCDGSELRVDHRIGKGHLPSPPKIQ